MEYAFFAAHRAARRLIAHAGFTALAIGCLALGASAAGVAWQLLAALVIAPPDGVARPERVVRVYFPSTAPAAPSINPAWTSYPTYEDIRRDTVAFQGLAALWTATMGVTSTLTDATVRTALVSDNYFDLLGVQPLIGRVFHARRSRDTGASAVVSYRFWRNDLHSASNVVGLQMDVDGQPLTVIGVAAPPFTGIDPAPTDVWASFAVADRIGLTSDMRESRAVQAVRIIARLRDHRSRDAAAARLSRALRADGDIADSGRSHARVMLGPLNEGLGPNRAAGSTVAIWVAGIAALVLLVSCATVAGLFLARLSTRHHELSVAHALGATTLQLLLPVVFEIAFVAAAGALVGSSLTVALRSFGGFVDIERLQSSAPRPVLVIVGLVAITALVTSIAPLWHTARTEHRWSPPHVRAFGGRTRLSGLGVLVLFEIAAVFSLILGAVGLVGRVTSLLRVDLGIDAGHLQLVTLGRDRTRTAADRAATFRQLQHSAAVMPGVLATSLSSVPLFWSTTTVGVGSRRGGTGGMALMYAVDSAYFGTLAIPIRRGRGFTGRDGGTPGSVAVVNAAAANLLWPGQNPLGQCFAYSASLTHGCTTVVGLVPTGKYARLTENPTPAFYIALRATLPKDVQALYVRTDGSPAADTSRVRAELQRHVAGLARVDVHDVTDGVASQIRAYRIGAAAFLAFGCVATLLAGVGLFGMTSLLFRERLRELALRVALGSTPAGIAGMVLRRAALLSAAGCAGGLILGVALGSIMRATMPGVTVIDAAGVVVAVLVVACATVLAVLSPIHHALRIAPMRILVDA